MKLVLFDSELLLQKLKQEKNWVSVAGILVLAIVLIAILPFFLSGFFSTMNAFLKPVIANYLLEIVGLILVLGILASLFFAFLICTTMHTLTANKHGFYEALASTALFNLWLAYCLLVSGIVLSIALPFAINIFLALLLFFYFLVKAIAVLFRSIKELYEAGYQTVLVAMLIILTVNLLVGIVMFILILVGLALAAIPIISGLLTGFPARF